MTQAEHHIYDEFDKHHLTVLYKMQEAVEAVRRGSPFTSAAVDAFGQYVLALSTWAAADDFLSTRAGVIDVCKVLADTAKNMVMRQKNKEC